MAIDFGTSDFSTSDPFSSSDPFATTPAPIDNNWLNSIGLSTSDPVTGNISGGFANPGENTPTPPSSNPFSGLDLTNLANYLAQLWGINKSANAMTAGLNQAAQQIQLGTGQGVNAIQQGLGQSVPAIQQGTQQGAGAVTSALAPFSQGGQAALGQLLANLGIPGHGQAQDITQVPGFQKQLAAITGALGNSATARGMGLSTNALAGMADATGQLSRSTWDDLQQQLSGTSGIGLGASQAMAGDLASLFGQQGNQLANLFTGAGTNLANLYTGQGRSLADLFTQRGQVQGTQAAAQANAAGGGGGGGIGGIIKDIGGIAGAIGSIGSLFSDRVLKTNIQPKGTYKGHKWYEFDYVWGDHGEGVMADEVMETNPEAVHIHPTGFLMVDYERL